MNKVLLSLTLGVFVLTAPVFAQPAPPGEPPAEPVAAAVKSTRHEKHPEIHKAMRELRLAKTHLESAAHDYGGHRVKALAAINEALEQLKAALDFDKS
jgi:hypothetical protein